MLCTLVAIFWGQSFELGLYQVCLYDCGRERPNYEWYDRSYVVPPSYICPARFYET